MRCAFFCCVKIFPIHNYIFAHPIGDSSATSALSVERETEHIEFDNHWNNDVKFNPLRGNAFLTEILFNVLKFAVSVPTAKKANCLFCSPL